MAQRQTHDGAHGDNVFATSCESAIRKAGFDVLVIPNPWRRRGLGAHRNGAASHSRISGCSPHHPAPAQLERRGGLAKAHNR